MKKYIFFFLLIVFNTISLTQERVRVMCYNLHNYPNNQDVDFKKIINQINPDALVVVEMIQQNGVTQFLGNSLSTSYTYVPVQIKATNSSGNDGNDCAFYYKSAALTLIEYKTIPARTRVISKFTLVHNTTNDTLIIFGVHLKANDFSSDNVLNAQKRSDAVQSLRSETNQYKVKTNYLVCGDFNIFSSSEPAFQKLIDPSSTGYFIDLLNISGNWTDNAQFSAACTYSTTDLDTRLDMILVSPSLQTPGGVDYKSDSFKIFGNDDGSHFNRSISDGANAWFPNDPSIGVSLKNASDHLPVYADFNFGVKTGIAESENIPLTFELKQNYPNPFNPTTVIGYQLSVTSKVSLRIYDLLGREVETLVDKEQQPGFYNSQFSTFNISTGRQGAQLPTGVYYYQLKVGNFVQTKKMMVLK